MPATCVYCQEPLEPGWAACPACLTPTAATLACTGCGGALRTTWRQCPRCGHETPWARAAGVALASRSGDRTPRGQEHTGLADFTGGGNARFADLTLGSTVAERYVVLTKLGQGGFGTVYRVFDLLTRDERALKVVAGPTGRPAEHLLQEFRLTDQVVEHHHVIRVYDPAVADHEAQRLVLLPMQLADGGNLRQWMLAHRDLGERRPEAIRLFLEACRGLHALHSRGLVHLDLKPENILLHEGSAKVADFGIGRIQGAGPGRNLASGRGLGTARYMSPEQHGAAAPDDVGAASDVYSLGVILHELLSGAAPFDGDPRELRRRHLEEVPSRPTAITDAWWSIVARCLAKRPTDRYGAVTELMTNVEGAPSGDGAAPATQSPGALDTPLGEAVVWLERLLERAGTDVNARLAAIEGELRELAAQDASAADGGLRGGT